ncbi:peptide-methionine (S)-S-oxide reductase [Flavobacteriaceae bacterium S356]|uniref:peptide-methionine (S)-S-oxide reductase n=1 Tax=Asprobacillus argus TaxID=3076534 RepID=A0ABU3LCL3_9FLAO|nr:peptide-methionine (S)-S-oxide reductase [Flavobacteriaceae bacterium S356]
MEKIGLGGGCHWCTEAVFQSLKGVSNVAQGYIASKQYASSFSEGAIIEFDSAIIPLHILLEIHVLTHKSMSDHSMRPKYRSAIYTFSDAQRKDAKEILRKLEKSSSSKIITEVISYHAFKSSREEILNYYYNNPEKPFCKTYIDPKIKILQTQFSDQVNNEKISHLLEIDEEYKVKHSK